MPYRPPSHPLEVLQRLNLDEAFGPRDPRFVDTDAARGGVGTQRNLARKFGLDLEQDRFHPNQKRHVLLFGPIGSGKSTELLRLDDTLRQGRRLLPIVINVRSENRLIEYSGGHPRELLRLLRMACELTESDCIEAATVERAIDKLAADFRYWLQPEDYRLLAQVDADRGAHVGNDERTRNLLWRLALLHYNDGSWRATHPVVRRLEGYQQAWRALPPVPDKHSGSSRRRRTGKGRS